VCPACGFKSEPKCDVITKDGELVEFVSRNTVKVATQGERLAFYAQLWQVEGDRGYKRGWAAQQYNKKIRFVPTVVVE
jgi:hypothetical protein